MSEFAKQLKKGTSLSFVHGSLDPATLKNIRSAGFDCIEISMKMEPLVHKYGFIERAEEYGKMIADAGLELWSLHLPFARTVDISLTRKFERDYATSLDAELIKAAAKAGAKVCVLHPSSEPIDEKDRPMRVRRSHESVKKLAAVADSVGITLAVENLPRTCLTRTPDEMAKILEGTSANMCFDANHSLTLSNLDYLKQIKQYGIKVATVHFSDYDFINERHRIPGDGINDWNAILASLEDMGYAGPLMYEVSAQPADRSVTYTLEQLSQNMDILAEGKL